MKVLLALPCLILYDPMNCSPVQPSSVPGILQARILEWVAIPFSRGSSWPRDQTSLLHWQTDSLIWATKEIHLGLICVWMSSTLWVVCTGMLSHFSCVCLFAILWTIACQCLLSMGFTKQEYCLDTWLLAHYVIQWVSFSKYMLQWLTK